jgi:PAS domain S-box-containing protein
LKSLFSSRLYPANAFTNRAGEKAMKTQQPDKDDSARLFRARAEAIFQLGRNWVWDLTTDRVYWSEEMIQIYGVSPEQFGNSNTSLAKLIHRDDLWKQERAIREVRQGKKIEPFEYRVVRPDLTERVVLVKNMQYVESADGKTSYLFGAVQDITESKQLEEQLGLLNAQLEQRVRTRTAELEQANLRLRELDRLKSMFIATTSHELRTPLNSIIGFLSVTLQGLSGELNDEQKDNLSRAYGSAMHLLSLVSDVIDITKLEAGKTEVFAESFLLDEVIDEATGVVAADMVSRGLTLAIEAPPATTLCTDRKRLLQCLINLLGNAVKFTERGSVRIYARSDRESLELSVSDTGIGVAQKDIPRLFQPFERLDSHLSVKAGGTGLGLYLTKKLCTDILRGTISMQSREGEGSTFTLKVARDITGAMGDRCPSK